MKQLMGDITEIIRCCRKPGTPWGSGYAACCKELEKILTRAKSRAEQEPLEPRPKIITLCGSSRFIEHFAILAWEFEKLGYIALGLHYLPPSYKTQCADHIAEVENVAKQMDALHLRKIEMSDRVFILNVDGYIGESTTRELAYAQKLGKRITYFCPEKKSEAEAKARAYLNQLPNVKEDGMKPKLKPCPFCGDTEIELWHIRRGQVVIMCGWIKGCGAKLFANRKREAIKCWNRRVR